VAVQRLFARELQERVANFARDAKTIMRSADTVKRRAAVLELIQEAPVANNNLPKYKNLAQRLTNDYKIEASVKTLKNGVAALRAEGHLADKSLKSIWRITNKN
jgi:hypothetical protein